MDRVLTLLLVMLLLLPSCRRPVRHYSRAEVVGEYVFAWKNEGLILGPDGVFEHCWSAEGRARSEHGKWELHASPEVESTVTLFHQENPGFSGYPDTPKGPWDEGVVVTEIDHAVGLMLPYYKKGRYYLKQPGGYVCPRP